MSTGNFSAGPICVAELSRIWEYLPLCMGRRGWRLTARPETIQQQGSRAPNHTAKLSGPFLVSHETDLEKYCKMNVLWREYDVDTIVLADGERRFPRGHSSNRPGDIVRAHLLFGSTTLPGIVTKCYLNRSAGNYLFHFYESTNFFFVHE